MNAIDSYWPLVRRARKSVEKAPVRVVPEEILYAGFYFQSSEVSRVRLPFKFDPESPHNLMEVPSKWPWLPGYDRIDLVRLFLTPNARKTVLNVPISPKTLGIGSEITLTIKILNNMDLTCKTLLGLLMRARNTLPATTDFV